MKLTFAVAVKDSWQLQPCWLHTCKVCDQGRSVGKIKFARNRKIEIKDATRGILTLFEALFLEIGTAKHFWTSALVAKFIAMQTISAFSGRMQGFTGVMIHTAYFDWMSVS